MERDALRALKARTKLTSLIAQTVRLRRSGSGFIGRCIFHQDSTPSFHVSDLRNTYKCFGCGAHGDAIDWLMQTRAMTFKDAVAALGGEIGVWEFARIVRDCPAPAGQDEDEARRIKHAHGLWLRRKDLAGSVAETYLRRVRGLSGPFPRLLGSSEDAYCSALEATVPALVAPLQDEHGHVTAVQQIYLSPAAPHDALRDEKGRRLKRTFGAMRGGAVRLSPPDTLLGLAGSVEDGLSAQELFSLPVWAVCGEARFSQVWTPPETTWIVIFADNDSAGRKFAEDAARKFRRNGRFVEIVAPEDSKDWNQHLQEHA